MFIAPVTQFGIIERHTSLEVACSIQLCCKTENSLGHERGRIDDTRRVIQVRQGVLAVAELIQVHCPYLVAELGLFRLLESIVAQRDNHVLPPEIHSLQLERCVPVAHLVGFLIVDAAEHLECQIILRLGHLYHRRIGNRHADIALAGGMVINQHAMHDSGLVVLGVDTEHIAVDAVVECSGRDIDFFLGLADIVAQRENLVVRHRHQIIRGEKRKYADYCRTNDNR